MFVRQSRLSGDPGEWRCNCPQSDGSSARRETHTPYQCQAGREILTARHVGEAARHGDLVAQQIIAEAGYYLGIAIAGIINFSNPSMVVVGGGVAQMGDLLLEPIRHVVRERSIQPAAQAARITAAVLGRRSTSIGAVVQAVDTVLYELTEGSLNAERRF